MRENKLKLSIENFNYKHNEKILFEDANVQLEFEKLIISGKNGAGKSTFIKLIHNREIAVINKQNSIVTTSLINQEPIFVKAYSALENAHIFKVDIKQFKYLIHNFNPTINLYQKIDSLSGGQQQVINLALGLALDRQLYLIDEPFNNIDKGRKNKIEKYLEETEKNLIIISHQQLENDNFDKIEIKQRSFNHVDS